MGGACVRMAVATPESGHKVVGQVQLGTPHLYAFLLIICLCAPVGASDEHAAFVPADRVC